MQTEDSDLRIRGSVALGKTIKSAPQIYVLGTRGQASGQPGTNEPPFISGTGIDHPAILSPNDQQIFTACAQKLQKSAYAEPPVGQGDDLPAVEDARNKVVHRSLHLLMP